MTYDYDLIVVGGGAAGLTASGVAANLGARALLLERHRLGGDCTWTGCVPSKTLLHAAALVHDARHASRIGLSDTPVDVDFGRLMRHLQAMREAVYEEADRPEIYERMGITVRHGEARLLDDHTLEITHEGAVSRATGRILVIATGARPAAPPIEGLCEVPYLTSETLFELEQQPRRLAVLGAGPIGTEMAQAFARLGTEVHVVDRGEEILRKDDPELARMLRGLLEADGVRYHFGATVRRVERSGAGLRLHLEAGDDRDVLDADALLVAVGRQPNVEALGLEQAGVAYTARGVSVDKRGRTNRRHIYAVGDVTGAFAFTHMSEHTAKVAVAHALLKLPLKIDAKHLPWVTYTDPELAHVGATEAQLRERGTSYRMYRFPFDRIDRAITEGRTEGLIKIYARHWNGRILGASILGAHAGDLIGELAVAMRNGVSLRDLSDTIHPYPTYALGVRRAADQWYIQHQSPTLVRLTQKLFGYRGKVLRYGPEDVV